MKKFVVGMFLLSCNMIACAIDNKVEEKQQFLQKIQEELSNKKTPDIEKLIKYIKDTSLLLKNILENKNCTKEQLQEELNKFNKNMKEIEDLYQSLINKKSKTRPTNPNNKIVKISEQTAIVTLNWQKKPRHDLTSNSGAVWKENKSQLTVENVQNYIASRNAISNTDIDLEKKKIPDGELNVNSTARHSNIPKLVDA